MIQLTDNPIEVAAVLESVRCPAAGAVVLFLGTAREMTGARRTSSLEYQAYPEMARVKLAELEREARSRWPLVECSLVHRLGHLAIGEVSVAIAVSSAHREPAFEAGKWLIDQIKEVVPIWKKENWANGTSEWVHPGLETSSPHERIPQGHEETPESHRETSETHQETPETGRKTSEMHHETSETRQETLETHHEASETRQETPETRHKASEIHRATPETHQETSSTPTGRDVTP